MFAFILPMLTKNILNMLDIVNLLSGLINISNECKIKEYIPNKFPFDINNQDSTSFTYFFFYEKIECKFRFFTICFFFRKGILIRIYSHL